VALHEFLGVFLFLRVYVVILSFGASPAAVPIVSAIVSIPAEHILELRPSEEFSTTKDSR